MITNKQRDEVSIERRKTKKQKRKFRELIDQLNHRDGEYATNNIELRRPANKQSRNTAGPYRDPFVTS
jgi:hypothetical protein